MASQNSKSPLLKLIASLGLGLLLLGSHASPAQANVTTIISNIKTFLGINGSAGSAASNNDGGGGRDICQAPAPPVAALDPDELELEDLFAEPATPAAPAPASSSGYPYLVALVPPADSPTVLQAGNTANTRPHLGLYMPISRANRATYLELSVANSDTGAYHLERQRLALPAETGWTSIQLPEPALETGILYHWTLALRCIHGGKRTLQEVEGLILRTDGPGVPEPQDYAIYLEQGLWYDAVTLVMEGNRQDRNNFLSAYLQILDERDGGNLAEQLGQIP